MNDSGKQEILRLLPSVDALLNSDTAKQITNETGAKNSTVLARKAIADLRRKILAERIDKHDFSPKDLLEEAEKNLALIWQKEKFSALQKVINATGVIIHTNLGRAPLSENAQKALIETAAGYCNLEYDIETGKRGRRGANAELILAEICGAEAALIVNNCAAAAFLILKVFAENGEVVISRGELVEIGGDFRIPDVLEQSGAILREVGTTNRTKISDYERATNERTKLYLKVHPSNYRITGFTETPDLKELATLAHRNNILIYEDAGSGAIFDLSKFGLMDEPVIKKSIEAGVDIVSFSGDKLFGGVQSGLIIGRKNLIERIRKNPLYRAFRADKLIYAALTATLEAFRRETVFEEIPVLKMLAATKAELKTRAENFIEKFGENDDLKIEIVEGNSVIGGGSAPTVQPETVLLAVTHQKYSAVELEEKLRLSNPPIVSRILKDKVLLDLRTVFEDEEIKLINVLRKL